MGFIADPTLGPSPKVPDGGVLYNGAAPTTPATLSKTVVSRPHSAGLVFRIQCNVDGDYIVRYIDVNGTIRTLQATTAYTATSNLIEDKFDGFVREAYVEFVPDSSASSLYIEGWSYGAGI